MKKVDECLFRQLVEVVIEGAERPDHINIGCQITVIVAFSFDWRETAATH
jgi:hypothetical protein